MLDKMERKIGRFAIPGLMNYMIMGYIVGYLAMMVNPNLLAALTLEPYMIVNKFQIWRLITWVVMPPSSLGIFTIIMLFFYWQLGRTLEGIWGTFRFNVFIFGGIILTVIGAMVSYVVIFWGNESLSAAQLAYYGISLGKDSLTGTMFPSMGAAFSTYYINLSIFLAFALTVPDMRVYLYFILPIRMIWLAALYVVMTAFSFFGAGMVSRITIICSVLNFVIFFYLNGRFKGIVNRSGFGSRRNADGGGPFGSDRRRGPNPFENRGGGSAQNPFGAGGAYQNRGGAARSAGPSAGSKDVKISRHKCAICGRTEITNPELEFRFCSKCNGNYEYCSDHLFNHNHVE